MPPLKASWNTVRVRTCAPVSHDLEQSLHFVHAFQQPAPHDEHHFVSGASAGPMQSPAGHVHDLDRVRVPEPQEAGHADQAPQPLQQEPHPGWHAWCE